MFAFQAREHGQPHHTALRPALWAKSRSVTVRTWKVLILPEQITLPGVEKSRFQLQKEIQGM